MPFLRAFKKNRGLSDTAYLGAWLLYHLIGQYDEFKGIPDYYQCLGYGIDFPGIGVSGKTKTGFHGYIDFFYFIAPDILRVYKVQGSCSHTETWEVVEEHEIP